MPKSPKYTSFAWFVAFYNLLVVLWGAVVRATNSGAGCGSDWPVCQGEIIPSLENTKTLIEYIHRLSSGLALILVLALLLWGWKLSQKDQRMRKVLLLSFVFLILEALLGAGLVIFDLVAENVSLARAWYITLHLANTSILLGLLFLSAWWSDDKRSLNEIQKEKNGFWVILGLVLSLLLIMSGGISALGHTVIYRQGIPAAGWPADVKKILFWVQLHPGFALVTSIYLFALGIRLQGNKSDPAQPFSITLRALLFLQLAAGILDLVLASPLWMQIIHLLLAKLIWLVFILYSVNILSRKTPAESPAV